MANDDWGPDHEIDNFLDGREFKAYAAKVRGIIHAADSPVSIRTIHRALGDETKREWTCDALESIADIEPVSILPTKYAPIRRYVKSLKDIRAETDMRRFFPNRPPDLSEPDAAMTGRSAR